MTPNKSARGRGDCLPPSVEVAIVGTCSVGELGLLKRCFRPQRLDAIAYELHDEAQFVLAQERFDCADDPGLAVDF